MGLRLMESVLFIEGHTFPPLSLRDCTQTLSYVPLGKFKRTLNGELLYLEGPQKFTTTLRGTDIHPPCFGSLVLGSRVRVHCLQRLWESWTAGASRTLMRPAVPGSILVMTQNKKALEFWEDAGTLRLSQDPAETLLVSYRPLLDMRVKSLETVSTEVPFKTEWALVLEEG